MSDVIAKSFPETLFHFLNAWIPGFLFEMLFLLTFYEPLGWNDVTLSYFGADSNLIFTILFIIVGLLCGYLLLGVVLPLTILMNSGLFKRSKKITLKQSDLIDLKLTKEVGREVEDIIIIQVLFSELSMISLIFAFLFAFNANSFLAIISFFICLLFFGLSLIYGWITVRKYENLSSLLDEWNNLFPISIIFI